jgi:hypothetical protein
MRSKFSMWSDYGTPAQKHWMSTSKRGTRTSIGPKILVAAVVVVAGVIGISGIYPQVIDEEWVQNAGTRPSLSAPTTRRSGIVAAIPLPPRRAVTTGEGTELSQLRTTLAAVEPLAETTAPAGVAEIPDAQAKADAPRPAPAVAAKTAAERSGPTVAAKKRVARVGHHQRSYSRAYAQYGGRGWAGGDWTGFSPFGNFRRF